jgi:serine/threonine protein kinase
VTLAEAVASYGRPPSTLAVDFVRRLALGLSAAHRRGVYAALHPGNILVLEFETKVSGRIIAKVARQAPRLMRRRAAPSLEEAHYMAPEALTSTSELRTEAPPTAAAIASMDVYACGALLHYLCTGRPPFESDSMEQLAAMHASGVPANLPALAPQVPEPLQQVIVRTLARDPKQRIADADTLATALSHVESSLQQPIDAWDDAMFDEVTAVMERGGPHEQHPTESLVPAARRVGMFPFDRPGS